MSPVALYEQIATELPGASLGKLFGKPCYKINGKAFTCFFQQEMVFKLAGEAHRDALSLAGAKLFDPSGKGRPMKAWVQVPFEHQERWKNLAEQAVMQAG